MLVKVGSTDISDYINETSYKMDVADVSTSWVNGNNVTIYKKVRTKVSGSFTVALYGKDDMDAASFLKIWNGAVGTNGTISIIVFVPALDKTQAIDAIYSIKSSSHRKLSSGKYMDVFEITLEER